MPLITRCPYIHKFQRYRELMDRVVSRQGMDRHVQTSPCHESNAWLPPMQGAFKWLRTLEFDCRAALK